MTDITIDDSVDMFTRGPGATVLVQAVRVKLSAEYKARKIAVGRRKPGQSFVIETEEDAHDANDTQTQA